MKYILFIFVLLCTSVTAFAQSTPVAGVQNAPTVGGAPVEICESEIVGYLAPCNILDEKGGFISEADKQKAISLTSSDEFKIAKQEIVTNQAKIKKAQEETAKNVDGSAFPSNYLFILLGIGIIFILFITAVIINKKHEKK
jgi:hypothetical protein